MLVLTFYRFKSWKKDKPNLKLKQPKDNPDLKPESPKSEHKSEHNLKLKLKPKWTSSWRPMVNLPTILRLLFCFKLLFYFYMDCVCLNLIHIFVTSINQENNCHEVVNTVFWMLWKFHSTQIFGTMKPRLSNIFDDIVHMFLETSNTTNGRKWYP